MKQLLGGEKWETVEHWRGKWKLSPHEHRIKRELAQERGRGDCSRKRFGKEVDQKRKKFCFIKGDGTGVQPLCFGHVPSHVGEKKGRMYENKGGGARSQEVPRSEPPWEIGETSRPNSDRKGGWDG